MPGSIPRRELLRKFRALGFEGPYSGGKHQFMIRGPSKVRIPNPHENGGQPHPSSFQSPLAHRPLIIKRPGVSMTCSLLLRKET